MPGPGEYRPDSTLGITRPEDLPKPNVSVRSRNYRRRPCPHCGHRACRDRLVRRTLHDLGDTLTERPRDIVLLCSQHYCRRCRKYFNADSSDLADPGSHYTRRVSTTPPSDWSSRTSLSPPNGPSARPSRVRPLCHDPEPGRGRGGKRRRDGSTPSISTGPWPTSPAISPSRRGQATGPSALSIVDNRTFKRLTCQVLDHDPTHVDITAFFGRFHRALTERGLTVKGSPPTARALLYPEPIAAASAEIPHQVCTFHVIREVTKAVLSAVAQERKRLAATSPRLPRGRPGTKAARRAARRKEAIGWKVGRAVRNRYPFVRTAFEPSQRRRRGLHHSSADGSQRSDSMSAWWSSPCERPHALGFSRSSRARSTWRVAAARSYGHT